MKYCLYIFVIIFLASSGTAYVKYEKGGETKWKCEDEISDLILTYEEAVKGCDKNPSCKFIEQEDCSRSDRFKLCTLLAQGGKSCVFKKNEEKMTTNTMSSTYITYEKDNHTSWECKEKTGIPASSFDAAVAACDADQKCNYIENEDCSGTEGFELCISLEKDAKSCAFKKTAKTEKGNGGSAKHPKNFYFFQIITGIVVNKFISI